METDKQYGDRVKELAKKLGGKDAVAAIMGKSAKSVERYFAGHDMPLKDALALSQAAGVSTDWLANGSGDVSVSHVQGQMQVPVVSMSASAGHGQAVLREDVVDYIALGDGFVRSLGLQRGELFIMSALGDSMEPRILSGELMLCSKAQHHLRGVDGTYVVRLEGDILVKRIQRVPGNKVVVSSQNSAYAPFEVTLDDGIDFEILGLVVLVLRRV